MKMKDMPFVVKISFGGSYEFVTRTIDPDAGQICSGVIISKQHILTAASCMARC